MSSTVAIGSGSGSLPVFVYVGALIDAEFDRSRALGRVPAVFFQAVLIVGVVGLLALLSSAGGGTGGGGTGGTPGSRDASTGTKRGNFASDLVDPVECAAMLGVTSVSVDAMGFDLPGQSMARMALMNGSRRSGTRLLISVYRGPHRPGVLGPSRDITAS